MNRTCPAAAPYSDVTYVLRVTSDRVNNSGMPVNTVITFKPAP